MLGSALALAMGISLLTAVRLSGNPQGFGLAVALGVILVAIACASHASAVLDRLEDVPSMTCLAVKVATWVSTGGGTIWLVGRAPGDEVLVVLIVVPMALGIVGLVVTRDSPWPAVAFLVLAGLLTILLGPIWLERHAGVATGLAPAAPLRPRIGAGVGRSRPPKKRILTA